MRPLVSVCIPTHNRSERLVKCIKSILNQSFKNYEIIVSDNNSTDDTRKKIEQFKKIRYFKNRENIGMIANWNRCIKRSKGKYIAIFHDDDLYDRNILKKEVGFLESNSDCGLVFTACHIDSGIKTINKPFEKDMIFDRKSLTKYMITHGIPIITPSVMVHKECYENVGNFNPLYKGICDYEMWIRIAEKYKIGYIAKSCMTYKKHGSNMTYSDNSLEIMKLYRKIIMNFARKYSNENFEKIVNARFSRLAFFYTIDLLSKNSVKNASSMRAYGLKIVSSPTMKFVLKSSGVLLNKPGADLSKFLLKFHNKLKK